MRGGLGRGARYLDNLDVTLTVDAERVFGWRGATLFAYGLYNNGRRFSESLIGDAQGVSNIETGVRAARLYEAWAEQRFASDRASVKFGLYDLNSEFDAIETAGLFLNPSHGIGPDFSQSGRNGPSIFPSTSLAVRGEFEVSPQWRVRAALLDGVPGDADRPGRTAIRLSKGDGAQVVAELDYRRRDTRAAVGYWRYTGRFEDIHAAGRNAEPAMRGGNDGLYMLLERRLTREEADGPQGLAGWLRLGFADERLNAIERYVGGGLAYTGPFRGRDEDRIGVAAGLVGFGGPFRRAPALEAANNVLEASELIVEATYRAPVARWLTLQPDVQYVIRPGGHAAVRNALIVGLRVEVGF
ncbi:MAG TPA: carbohydrate porin [Sphingomonadaceae bacterium]|nr:carbohydrate porin [Sphingomonadaceae bacterium]